MKPSAIENHSPNTTAISYSRIIARQLGLHEKNLWKLLKGTGISAKELLDDDIMLFNEQQLQIITNAIEYSGNPGFGLVLGQALTPPSHGPLGFLAYSSPNLLTIIEDFRSFLPSRASFTSLRTEFDNNHLVCYFDIDIANNDEVYRCVLECFALSLISLIEFVLGRAFTEGKLYCGYPRPHYHRDYKKYIHTPTRFGVKENKLLIPETLLYTPNLSSNHRNYEFALKQCQQRMEQLDNTVNRTTNRIRKLLLLHRPGELTETKAASLNFISKRTLARRLEAEQSSFRELKEEVLASLAADYLRSTDLTVEAIAAMLSYHDSSSFRRAFKRWFNMTPQNFRQNSK